MNITVSLLQYWAEPRCVAHATQVPSPVPVCDLHPFALCHLMSLLVCLKQGISVVVLLMWRETETKEAYKRKQSMGSLLAG